MSMFYFTDINNNQWEMPLDLLMGYDKYYDSDSQKTVYEIITYELNFKVDWMTYDRIKALYHSYKKQTSHKPVVKNPMSDRV